MCEASKIAAAYVNVFEASYTAARDVTAGLLDDVLVALESAGGEGIVEMAARDELDAREHSVVRAL